MQPGSNPSIPTGWVCDPAFEPKALSSGSVAQRRAWECAFSEFPSYPGSPASGSLVFHLWQRLLWGLNQGTHVALVASAWHAVSTGDGVRAGPWGPWGPCGKDSLHLTILRSAFLWTELHPVGRGTCASPPLPGGWLPWDLAVRRPRPRKRSFGLPHTVTFGGGSPGRQHQAVP